MKIDERNRTSQDDLQLERKLQTKDWSIKVNTLIHGIYYVDTYYLGKSCEWWYDRNPAEFYYNLTEDMIDNMWTEIRTRRNQVGQPRDYLGYIINSVPHCNPTEKKRKRKTPNGLVDTKFLKQ